MIISPIQISKHNYQYNNNGQHLSQISLHQIPDRFEPSFCGIFEESQIPIRLDQAQCYVGIHCPLCGTAMTTQQDYNEILKQAANASNAGEFIEILKNNKKFIPQKYRHIFNDIEKITNYEELSISDFRKEMSEIAFYHKMNKTREIKDYLKNYAGDFPKKNLNKALETLDKIKAMQPYNMQRDEIFQFTKDLELNQNQINDIMAKVLKPLLYSNGYYMLFNSSKLLQIPENYTGIYIAQRLFYPSLSTIAPISRLSQHANLPNNNVLLCKNCYPNSSKNISWNDENPNVLKENIKSYLTDISYLMGDNKIDDSPDYINAFLNIIGKISKKNVVFSPNEIQSVKNVGRLTKRHERFAPIEQSEIDIPCAECGSIMITHAKRKEIEYELKKCNTPYDYAKVLEKNMKYIGVYHKVLAKMFLQIVKNNPNISYEEFLKEYSQQKAHYCEKSVEQAISVFLTNRSYIANNYPPEYLNIYDTFTARLLKYISEGKFDNYEFTPLYHACIDGLDLQTYPVKPIYTLIKHLKSIAYKNLYASQQDKYKYNDKDEIYSMLFRLFRQNVATADHLVPEIKGGEGDKYNLIGLCKCCNKTKSKKDVNNWYSENKRLADNLKKQLTVVDNMAKTGKITGYDDWAKNISQKVYELTYHRLDLREDFK